MAEQQEVQPAQNPVTVDPAKIAFFLREQIRFHIHLTLSLAQWGATVLIGLQAALYFIRKETKDSLGLATGQLPLHRYLIGTFLLLIIAVIFHLIANWVGIRRRACYVSLHALEKDYPSLSKYFPADPKKTPRVLIRSIFYIFPTVDILLYAYSWLWSSASSHHETFLVALVTAFITTIFAVPIGIFVVQKLQNASRLNADGGPEPRDETKAGEN